MRAKARLWASGHRAPKAKPDVSKQRALLQLMQRMYAEGLSLKAIGEEIGKSHQYPYRAFLREGVQLRPCRGSGAEHSQWKGGVIPATHGYRRVWISPSDELCKMRNHHGYVLEHRLLLARSLGRPLLRSETVHHLNGNRLDNRLENLELHQGKHGKGVVMHCLDCGSKRIGFGPIGAVKEDN